MKALVYDGVETLGFRDMPDPVPAQGEHLIRVEAVGICGSDMHAYLGHDARRPRHFKFKEQRDESTKNYN